MRRRALLAASAASGGGGDYAYELHLEPEWAQMHFESSADVYGDFSALFSLLVEVTKELGAHYPTDYEYWELNDIPETLNITVDGIRLSSIQYFSYFEDDISIYFGDTIVGTLLTDMITLTKYN